MRNRRATLRSWGVATLGALCVMSLAASCKPSVKTQGQPLGSADTQRSPDRAPRAERSHHEYDEKTGLVCVRTTVDDIYVSVGEENTLQVILGPSAIIYTIEAWETRAVKELVDRAHRAWKSGSQVYVTFSTDDYAILRVADDPDPRVRER